MSENLKRDDFAKHEGTTFKGYINSDEPTDIKLTEVSKLKENDYSETFSLVLEAPSDAELVNGIIKVEHDKLGSFDLGVSPFAQDDKTTKYEAVFVYLKEDEEAAAANAEEASE